MSCPRLHYVIVMRNNANPYQEQFLQVWLVPDTSQPDKGVGYSIKLRKPLASMEELDSLNSDLLRVCEGINQELAK